ncbi:MAG: hypothetical protein C5B49_06025 [Bdellovibrio sp.]|nr:MAG: hypothetical protein C5B49_06025 [Bdellovibrio sp.]
MVILIAFAVGRSYAEKIFLRIFVIPHKADHRWLKFILGAEDPPVSNLSTKMMMMRVRMILGGGSSSERIQEAIDLAYDFFEKNELSVKEDIDAIFGKE